ncbi:glutamate--cysteine ligase [Candidatus Formimonas warabiya]|uniref:Glutamate--cysteine ligase n=1 Tax=Formimonas warabiya TaxID=1761012 RepID=A0A3G1KM89_FORW1|nr:glutamate--cysteine ligase [Candidatus Formimonas warabiya]ATW23558.1 glutamate--cysteine ligase [Candidatus Formimonas warabiya]
MLWNFHEMMRLFANSDKSKLLRKGNFGLELESQRITPSGDLALTPHPLIFGDKCQNPRITTDFAESQVEMITPTYGSLSEVYASLQEIRAEVEYGIQDELLWPLSMPPRLPSEEQIPIARFSDSKIGRHKEIYRRGLALRYGKKMQMISGIHYNFSFSDELLDYLFVQYGSENEKREFMDRVYLALSRNFLRNRWLLIYLFGASPFCDPTYYSVIEKELKVISQYCTCCCNASKDLYQYTTSLRVSRFGYSNTSQNSYNVFFNSLEEYADKLRQMLKRENPQYTKLGLFENGVPIQLNGNVLQNESEFYSSIRLKRKTAEGETQLDALTERGVQYIEVRMLDLNPFEQLGISQGQLYFLQVFMLYCLFEQSEKMTAGELEQINANHHLVALYGRKNSLMLRSEKEEMISLQDFGEMIFQKLKPVARLMDEHTGNCLYQQSVQAEYNKLMDISLLPSARMERERQENKESFLEFGIRQAVKHSLKDSALAYDPVIQFSRSPHEETCGGNIC